MAIPLFFLAVVSQLADGADWETYYHYLGGVTCDVPLSNETLVDLEGCGVLHPDPPCTKDLLDKLDPPVNCQITRRNAQVWCCFPEFSPINYFCKDRPTDAFAILEWYRDFPVVGIDYRVPFVTTFCEADPIEEALVDYWMGPPSGGICGEHAGEYLAFVEADGWNRTLVSGIRNDLGGGARIKLIGKSKHCPIEIVTERPQVLPAMNVTTQWAFNSPLPNGTFWVELHDQHQITDSSCIVSEEQEPKFTSCLRNQASKEGIAECIEEVLGTQSCSFGLTKTFQLTHDAYGLLFEIGAESCPNSRASFASIRLSEIYTLQSEFDRLDVTLGVQLNRHCLSSTHVNAQLTDTDECGEVSDGPGWTLTHHVNQTASISGPIEDRNKFVRFQIISEDRECKVYPKMVGGGEPTQATISYDKININPSPISRFAKFFGA